MADSLRVSVRLSAVTDLDLLVMAQTDAHIQWTTQQVIMAHLSDQKYTITLPEIKEVNGDGKSIFFRFSDPNIVTWLSSIPMGRRSVVIKTLLKQSITNPINSFMSVLTVKTGITQPVIQRLKVDKIAVKAQETEKTDDRPTPPTPKTVQPPIILAPTPTQITVSKDEDDIFAFI